MEENGFRLWLWTFLRTGEGSYLAFNVFRGRLLSVSEQPPGELIYHDKNALWKEYMGIGVLWWSARFLGTGKKKGKEKEKLSKKKIDALNVSEIVILFGNI